MGLSWPEFTSECKSRLSALARSLYLSRSRLEAKYNKIKIEIEERNLELKSRAAELQERNELIASQAARIQKLEESLAKANASNPAVLLKPSKPESIREDFERVKVQDVKNWLTKNLPATLSSKRQALQAHSMGRPNQTR